MDSDENITDGLLSKSLARDDIRMREAVHKLNRGRGPPTHFRGSDKWNGGIDGIWVQDDLEVVGTSFLPFDSDLGDHRPVVNDVLSRSVLVVPKKVIVRPKARRLPPRYQESKINTFNLLKRSSRSGRSRSATGPSSTGHRCLQRVSSPFKSSLHGVSNAEATY